MGARLFAAKLTDILIDFTCSYKLRIECMLLKEEFTANLSYLEPSINAMLYAGEGDDLMNALLFFFSPINSISSTLSFRFDDEQSFTGSALYGGCGGKFLEFRRICWKRCWR